MFFFYCIDLNKRTTVLMKMQSCNERKKMYEKYYEIYYLIKMWKFVKYAVQVADVRRHDSVNISTSVHNKYNYKSHGSRLVVFCRDLVMSGYTNVLRDHITSTGKIFRHIFAHPLLYMGHTCLEMIRILEKLYIYFKTKLSLFSLPKYM